MKKYIEVSCVAAFTLSLPNSDTHTFTHEGVHAELECVSFIPGWAGADGITRSRGAARC